MRTVIARTAWAVPRWRPMGVIMVKIEDIEAETRRHKWSVLWQAIDFVGGLLQTGKVHERGTGRIGWVP